MEEEENQEIFYDAVDWEEVIEKKDESMAEEVSRKNDQIKAVIEEKKMMERRKDKQMMKMNNEIRKKEEELKGMVQTLKRKDEIINKKERELVKVKDENYGNKRYYEKKYKDLSIRA